jgi:hypothetical protein
VTFFSNAAATLFTLLHLMKQPSKNYPEWMLVADSKNLVAVHCHHTSGGPYVDFGFAEIKPAPFKVRINANLVAQSGTLLYRRIVFGNALPWPRSPEFFAT